MGDLVNTAPGEGDWQQVLAVYATSADVADESDMKALVESLAGRYVVVYLAEPASAGGIYSTFFAQGKGRDHYNFTRH